MNPRGTSVSNPETYMRRRRGQLLSLPPGSRDVLCRRSKTAGQSFPDCQCRLVAFDNVPNMQPCKGGAVILRCCIPTHVKTCGNGFAHELESGALPVSSLWQSCIRYGGQVPRMTITNYHIFFF